MIEIILILLILGLTVFVHEFGHFASAKAMGIAVEKFSIGWGPKMVSVEKGGTEYQLSWLLLLGGFVKLAGEDPKEVHELGESAFLNQPSYKKIAVATSGVLMNLVFAVLLMWLVFIAGSDTLKPQMGDVKEGYPAAAAGIQKGDIITGINGKKVKYWNQLTEIIKENGLDNMKVTVMRNGEEKEFTVAPKIEETENVLKEKEKRPFIGISPLAYIPEVYELEKKYPAYDSGMKKGDRIIKVNGKKTVYWDEVTEAIRNSGGREMIFTIIRKGKEIEIRITPKKDKIKDEDGKETEVYLAGIVPESNLVKERYGPVKAFGKAFSTTVYFTDITVKALYKMIMRQIEPDVAGPIGVAHITYKVAKTGFVNLLLLFAIININLALFNFLPLLPLDGGLVLIFVIEAIMRRPVPLAVQDAMMQAGWFLLIFMLVFFTYKDILRLFGG